MKKYTHLFALILLGIICVKCSNQVNTVQNSNQVLDKLDSVNTQTQNDSIKPTDKQILNTHVKRKSDKVDKEYEKLILLYSQLYECQTYKNKELKTDCLSFMQHIKDKRRIWNDNGEGYKKEAARTTLKDIMKEESEVLKTLKKCERNKQ